MKKEVCRKILYSMKRIRTVEETIAARYSEGKMRCPTHLSTGQEAVSAVAGEVLRQEDLAVSGHRAHGHFLGKGGDLKRMLAEIHGKRSGTSAGKGGSMHLIDTRVGFMGSTAIVGGTIPVGVGLALSMQIKGTAQVACVFLGDGAVEEGVFYESVNFAVVRQLPVVFLCENNMYSVYSPLNVRQPTGRKIFEMAKSWGIESSYCSGELVRDIYHSIDSAVSRARAGRGPQFIEFNVLRWREHCGPLNDDLLGYRSPTELAARNSLDPIKNFTRDLLDSGVISKAWIDECEKSIANEVSEAFQYAEASDFPNREDAAIHVFSESVIGELN